MYHRSNPAMFASSSAKPVCPPGYTITGVKQSGGHVYSYMCASTSARPGPFSCPPGFKVTPMGKGQFMCTRISGQVKDNPQRQWCPPGFFYTEDLGCVSHVGGLKGPKPKCPPGLTWTEDLGCVEIPSYPRPGRKPKPKCPPGFFYTEDLGCVSNALGSVMRGRRAGNPGYWARPAANQACKPPCKGSKVCNYTTGKCEDREIKLPPSGDPLPNRAGSGRAYNPKDLLSMCCVKVDTKGRCVKYAACGPQSRRVDVIRRVRDRVRRATNPGCGCGPRVSNPDGTTACCASCAAGGPCGG